MPAQEGAKVRRRAEPKSPGVVPRVGFIMLNMRKIEKFSIMDADDLIKIAGGNTTEIVETNWWYCENTKPCDTTDVIGCSNSKPQLNGCK